MESTSNLAREVVYADKVVHTSKVDFLRRTEDIAAGTSNKMLDVNIIYPWLLEPFPLLGYEGKKCNQSRAFPYLCALGEEDSVLFNEVLQSNWAYLSGIRTLIESPSTYLFDGVYKEIAIGNHNRETRRPLYSNKQGQRSIRPVMTDAPREIRSLRAGHTKKYYNSVNSMVDYAKSSGKVIELDDESLRIAEGLNGLFSKLPSQNRDAGNQAILPSLVDIGQVIAAYNIAKQTNREFDIITNDKHILEAYSFILGYSQFAPELIDPVILDKVHVRDGYFTSIVTWKKKGKTGYVISTQNRMERKTDEQVEAAMGELFSRFGGHLNFFGKHIKGAAHELGDLEQIVNVA